MNSLSSLLDAVELQLQNSQPIILEGLFEKLEKPAATYCDVCERLRVFAMMPQFKQCALQGLQSHAKGTHGHNHPFAQSRLDKILREFHGRTMGNKFGFIVLDGDDRFPRYFPPDWAKSEEFQGTTDREFNRWAGERKRLSSMAKLLSEIYVSSRATS